MAPAIGPCRTTGPAVVPVVGAPVNDDDVPEAGRAPAHGDTVLPDDDAPEADDTPAHGDPASLPDSVARRRLSPVVVLVEGVRAVRRGGLPAIILLFGRPLPFVLTVLGVALVIGVPALVLSWQRWTYAVADDRMEVRRGVLNRSVRVVRLDRVRGVEVTAPLIPRLLGLVEVQVEVAAGGPGGAEIRLPAVRREEGDRLRALLLRRAPSTGPPAGESGGAVWTPPPPSEIVLHRSRPGLLLAGGATSLRFVLAPLALGAALLQTVDDLGAFSAVDPRGAADAVNGTRVTVVGEVVFVVLATIALVGLGALGQLVKDGGFVLTNRPNDGRLVSERGLLTRRSVGLDHARVRGVDVTQGLARRPFGLVHVEAVIGGATGGEPGRTALVPVAREAEAWAVAGAVLGPFLPVDALVGHPRAALPRRIVRAVAIPAALAAIAAIVGEPGLAIGAAVVTAMGIPLGYDRWRRLGHRTDGTWLVVGEGSIVRRRTVVAADAIVALRIVSSPTQRRAGLCTLHVDLGAGAGSRRALDLGQADAHALARDLLPTLTQPL